MRIPQSRELELRSRASSFARASGVAAVIVGAFGLLGWWLHVAVLIRVYSLLPPTAPNSAMSLILSGMALLLAVSPQVPDSGRRYDAMACAVAATVIVWLTIAEYILHVDLHIDGLLARFGSPQSAVRMSPTAAVALLAIDAGLILITVRRWHLMAQGFGLTASCIGVLGITGYAFVQRSLYAIGGYSPMSVEIAVGCMVLGLGVLCAEPDKGLMTILTSPNVGGVVARRLLPMGIGFPLLLGLLSAAGSAAQLGKTKFGAVILLFFGILLFSVPILWTAYLLYRTDRRRERFEKYLAAQYAVARILAGDGPAHSMARPILETVGVNLDWDAAVFWEAADSESSVGSIASWSDPGHAPVREPSDPPDFVRRAFAEKESIWIENTSGEFGSAAAFPIVLNGVAIGAVECLSRLARKRDADLVDVMEAVGIQIGQYIDRKRSEGVVRRLHRDLQDHAAKLEAANKELEAFSYSVSHDLRAPLRHISGFIQLLQKHAAEALDEQSRRYIGVIQKASAKMADLVDDLLSFSRMGRAELLSGPIDLNRMVRQVIQELSPSFAGRYINWRVRELPEARGDAAMIRVVLTNYLTNAIKYTSKRDFADIEIGVLQNAEEHETVIFVRDNGAGFDMKYAGKLFGVFQRLHREDDFEGTGIGLATARRIVHQHGGRTWAEGALGEGATFYFSLPVLMNANGSRALGAQAH